MSGLLVALAALLLGIGNATPTYDNHDRTRVVDERGAAVGGKLQEWVDSSTVPTPPGPLVVRFGGDEMIGTRAAYTAPGLPIAVRVGASLDRQQFMHEIGHQYDYRLGAAGDAFRVRVESILGLAGPWVAPPDSPHEQFAEAYGWVASTLEAPPHGYMASGVSVGYGLILSRARAAALRELLMSGA